MHLNHSGRIALMTALVAVMIFFQFGSGMMDSESIPEKIVDTPLATTVESIGVSIAESFSLKYNTDSDAYPYIAAYSFDLYFDPDALEFVNATDLLTDGNLVPYEREPGIIGFSSDGFMGAKTESGLFELTLKSKSIAGPTTVSVLLDDAVVMEDDVKYVPLIECLTTEKKYNTIVNVGSGDIPDKDNDEDEEKNESGNTTTTSTIVSNNIKKTADNVFTVQTSIVNNPGFGSFIMTLNYDPTKCTITENDVARGPLIPAGNTFGIKVDNGTVRISWLTFNGVNLEGDGTIATINVKSMDGTTPTIKTEKLEILKYTDSTTGDVAIDRVTATIESNIIDNEEDDGKDGDGGQASKPSQTETSDFNYFYIGIPIVVVGIIIALMARRD